MYSETTNEPDMVPTETIRKFVRAEPDMAPGNPRSRKTPKLGDFQNFAPEKPKKPYCPEFRPI